MSEFKIPDKIEIALSKLHEAGYEAFVVGGCVRDTLLNRMPNDWDITTSAAPNEIQNVFNGYHQIHTGMKYGTVTVVIDQEPIEITTYRIDGNYSDGRRPDKVSFTSDITADLARRDFCINACAATGTMLVDPFGGQDDIKNKLIRCVGDPIQRFTEDSLRILRGIRFASVLDFRIEEKTKNAMFECKDLLKNVSQERITIEFCKTLLGINVKNTLMEFHDIFACIVPEISSMVEFEQHNKYHVYDVFEHSLKAVESIDSDIILRVTMFFHDIAKPYCYSIDKKGVGHFYGHPEISAQMTDKILHRMKFSTVDIRTSTELIKYHDTQIAVNPKSIKKLLSKIGEEQFRRLLKVKKADILAKNPALSNERLKTLSDIEQILDKIVSEKCCLSIHDLAVNGDDLIQYGIPKGKKIGLILNRLFEMVINEEVKNEKDALIEKLKHMSY